MKKSTRILLVIGILLLAAGATLCNIAYGRGESVSVLLRPGALSVSGGFRFDQTGMTVCTSGEVSFDARELDSLSLDWISGSVRVERHNGAKLIVRESAKRPLKEGECLRWKLSGGKLTVLPCANGQRNLPEKELTVLVPESLTLTKLSVDVTSAEVSFSGLELKGELFADSTSGSLRAEDCRCGSISFSSNSGSQSLVRTDVAGELRAESTSGSFTAESLSCTQLDVESTSGSITLLSLESRTLELSSTSGSIRSLDLACQKAEAETTSGSVKLDFLSAPQGVEVETTSGSVTLAFPRGTGLALDYDSSSGSLRGEVVYGALPVEVDTTSGSLTIEYR